MTKEQEIHEDETTTALSNVRKYQAADDVTCIVSNYPDVNVVMNSDSSTKEVKIRDAVTDLKFVLAPGEGRLPSNIMRMKHFDAKGFPTKHKSGNYGLH